TIGTDVAKAPDDLAGAKGYSHIVADVSDEGSWKTVTDAVEAEKPARVGLVTAAAILDIGDIVDTTKEAWERSLRINVIGTALAMKAMIPLMLKRGGGPIVAVASIDATFAEQQLSVYSATKGAVRQLARTVAMDHARAGIRVNVLSPGPMMAGLFERHMKSAADPAKFEATRANRQPNGKILDPVDVGRAILFLLSDGAGAINGADVFADGGLTTSFDFRTGAEGASV
ncbi:MAG: SDR family oxidoreductase, partial [Bauldia sp.]